MTAQPFAPFDFNRANMVKPPKPRPQKPVAVSDTVRSTISNESQTQKLKVVPKQTTPSMPTPLTALWKKPDSTKQPTNTQGSLNLGQTSQVESGQDSAKRSSSPARVADQPKQKKVRKVGRCTICEQSPHHLAKECPVVLGGSQRYYQFQCSALI